MLCHTEPLTIGKLLVKRNAYNISPVYQRESGVWSQNRKQLFIDSLLNQYDVPKFYLHDLRGIDNRYDFAVVDGKQRLTAIWDFLDSRFPLAPDFDISHPEEADPPAGGKTFAEFTPTWAEIFKAISLDAVLIQEAEEEDIEEIFSRLNNGEPLNAAEKRNALGGKMNELIRAAADNKFFHEKLAFTNKRSSYLEIAGKFVLTEYTALQGAERYTDLKKKNLDAMVLNHKQMDPVYAERLQKRVEEGLSRMCSVFSANDSLLDRPTYAPLYYLFVRSVYAQYGHELLHGKLHRFLEDFRVMRRQNLKKDEDERDATLLEFDRLMQQGTMARDSLRTRTGILTRYFLQENPDVRFLDPKRAFTDEERFAMWILAEKRCEECHIALDDLSQMDADHELQHAFGGATGLENARCLCSTCNLKLAERIGH